MAIQTQSLTTSPTTNTMPVTGVTPYYDNSGNLAFTPTPAGAPYVSELQQNYTYSPNGTGGVNYFLNGTPITNTQYRAATGIDTGALEAQVADDYSKGIITNYINGAIQNATATSGTSGTTVNPQVLSMLDQRQTAATQAKDTAITDTKNYYNDAYQNLEKSIELGQGNLDAGSATNEYNLRTAIGKINAGLRANILGGLLRLSDQGAGFSSAQRMLPIALAAEGKAQIDEQGQRYELTKEDIARQQAAFDLSKKKQLDDINYQLTTAVNTVVANYMDAISTIEAARLDAGGTQKVALDQLQNEVLQQFATELNGLDKTFTAKINAISPQTTFDPAAYAAKGSTIAQNVNPDSTFATNLNVGTIPSSGFNLGDYLVFNTKGKDYQLG